MTTVYIAGPMTGQPLWGFQAFEDCAVDLKAQGFEVISPHDMDIDSGRVQCVWVDPHEEDDPNGVRTFQSVELSPSFDYEETLQTDLEVIEEKCQGIVLLPGWSNSPGAQRELDHAVGLGLDVWVYSDGVLTKMDDPAWVK